MTRSSLTAVLATAVSLAGARVSSAHEAHDATDHDEVGEAYDEAYNRADAYQAQGQVYAAQVPGQDPTVMVQVPVPPDVEQPPAAAPGGNNYCFGGAHPVDTRVVAGTAWDETEGTHLHPYPPFDLRLFVLRDGCYHFIGDPTDFGYRGRTYSYYGAHPVLESYGGGWCFMIGGHAHWWRPWSPYFTVAGPWFYWQGAYDPFFWNHWPYYAHYYRAYYPRYYGGGRFYRGRRHDRVVAPPIGRVAGRPARAMPSGAGGGFRTGGPAPAPARGSWNRTPGWSSSTSGWPSSSPGRASPAPADKGEVPSLGWSSRPGTTRSVAPAPAAPSGGWNGGGFTTPRSVRVQPQAGSQGPSPGWGGYRASPAPAAPSYRSAPSPSFRSSPAPSAPMRASPASPSSSSGSFRGGGFRSGGGGGWRR